MTRTRLAFVATINVPGYLPMDDEPPTFITAQEAWAWLAEERERGEDDTDEDSYSITWDLLTELGEPDHWFHPEHRTWLISNGLRLDGTGTVYGPTPGHDPDSHDLGLAYSVSAIS